MKRIVWKAYWDYEKEEKWLNEMSAKGLALTDYSWCRYVFEEAPKGKYIYRIELLNNIPSHPDSMEYIRFLEETGAECVATYMRWVYFRKEAKDGAFDLYSDIGSKIKHYKRILNFWLILSSLTLITGIANIFIGLYDREVYHFSFNLYLGIQNTLIGLCVVIILALPAGKKIRSLKKEKKIRE